MLPVTVDVRARDIEDAWFQCLSRIIKIGFKYVVQQGSFIGETRWEFDHVVIQIAHPYSEPYDTMLPKISPQLNIPDPVAPGYIDTYLPYLMTSYKEPGEDYTYGERISDQINHFIHLLKDSPNTNQAILQIAQPEDYLLKDPPCLRHIDMRINSGTLVFYPYFRSWDLWGGMPANLAAIAILQKYMADEIGVKSGPILAASKGLHIYGYVKDLTKIVAHRE